VQLRWLRLAQVVGLLDLVHLERPGLGHHLAGGSRVGGGYE
jgi:hypothetical protein